jgi:hypothetical protein
MAKHTKTAEIITDPGSKPAPRIRGWIMLAAGVLSIWLFAVVVGPWLEKRIPVFNEIVETIEEQDIDAGAYFYTEIKASYEGERYLKNALALQAPEQSGLTWPFLSAVGFCILLLWLGYRFLPMD